MTITCRWLGPTCAWIVLGVSAQFAEAAQQIFLVQNSGWMEPFYADPSSQFKPLIQALIGTVADPDETVTVATFNQQTADNPSPRMVYNGKAGAGQLSTVLNSISIATKGQGKALADTDFREAIEATINALQRQPGILWIFTNNKNSPKNDPDTVRRNREFYDLLHNAAPISRTIAFPLGMPVKGAYYSASGLMIYALAYGEEADRKLQLLVASGRIGRVLQDKPLRLKPLDADPVEFSAQDAGKMEGGKSVRVNFQGNRMLVDLDADDSKAPMILVRAKVTNIFNPYRIDNAKVSAHFSGAWQGDLEVSPDVFKGLDPGAGQLVEIKLPIPIASVPSLWSMSMLKEFGRTYTLQNQMELTLDDQVLSIPPEFRQRLQQIFPGDPMPDAFVPPDRVRKSTVAMPVDIRIHYPAYPIFLIGGSFAALALGLLALLSMRQGQRTFRVMVNGKEEIVSLKRFGNSDVVSKGAVVGRVSRGWSGARVSRAAEGYTISVIN